MGWMHERLERWTGRWIDRWIDVDGFLEQKTRERQVVRHVLRSLDWLIDRQKERKIDR